MAMPSLIETQPLAVPWRRAAKAARVHVGFERVASMVVEDQRSPVSRLDARVLQVELIARIVLTTAEGSTVEKRTISDRDAERLALNVGDTVAWATSQHPGITVTTSHDAAPVWRPADRALRKLGATVDDRVNRMQPGPFHIDRRPRV